jgi:hypothetical protein
LLALTATQSLDEIDIEELTPDKAHLPGGVLYQSGPVPASSVPAPTNGWKEGTLGAGVSSQVPNEEEALQFPDQAALIAAGAVEDLALAIIEHFMLVAEDPFSGAVPRVNAIVALGDLLPTSRSSRDLVQRLLAIYRNPRYTHRDTSEMGPTSSLSRIRFNMGGENLPAYALLGSAEALHLSLVDASDVTEID